MKENKKNILYMIKLFYIFFLLVSKILYFVVLNLIFVEYCFLKILSFIDV